MDTNNPQERLRALVKLRGRLDGKPSLWWYRGAQYALVNMESRVLWQVEGAQMTKFEPLEGGSWRHTMRDIMFYLDAKSSELLEEFRNPWTGETTKVPVARFGPFAVNYTLEGQVVDLPPKMRDSMWTEWRFEPVFTQGSDVYIRESGVTRIAKPGATGDGPAAFHHINDQITMIGRVSDVDDPKVVEAPARTAYGSVNDWTPWLKMGDRPGFVFGKGNSTKVMRLEDLPARLKGLIDRFEPDFFKDPTFEIWSKTFHPLNNQ